MTLGTLMLMVLIIYLVLIAYGIVGTRRRGLPRSARVGSAVLMVLIPPVAILLALNATGDAFLIARWNVVALAMFAAGAATAILAEFIARRIGQ